MTAAVAADGRHAWWHARCAAPDPAAAAAARSRQARLTKPAGSLGELELVAQDLAALQQSDKPCVDRVWISVFAADHGVAADGVSAFPQAVTGEMVRNFAGGGAAISVLARALDATLEVVHLGTVNDPGPIAGVRRAVIAPATAHFARAAAMDAAQLSAALDAGAASVRAACEADTQLWIGGEMGIGNTTSATALACALLRRAPAELAGAGTGLDADGIARKVAVVADGLARHVGVSDPLQQLRCLGGFEIAALVGGYVAAAQARLPVLVDGFIATVAALCAVRINPGVRDWLLFAHRSHERGHVAVLAALQATPLLDLRLRLGEASGAAVAVPLLRLACALHNGMATFDQAGVTAADGRAGPVAAAGPASA